MRTKTYALTAQAAAAASVAAAQHPVAGTALTLKAASIVFGSQAVYTLAPGLNYSGIPTGTPSEVTFTQLAGSSANAYTIVGLDRWGIAPITEVVATAAGAGVTRSSCVYSVVYSITPSTSDGSHNVSAGVPQRVTSPWVQLDSTRGFDQAQIAFVSIDNLIDTPTFVVEGTAVSINEQGVGVDAYPNLPTYFGDDAPVDSSNSASSFPFQIPQGSQWARVVITSGAGSSGIARFVRAGF